MDTIYVGLMYLPICFRSPAEGITRSKEASVMHHVKETTNNGSLGLVILSVLAGVMAIGSMGYAPAAKAAIECTNTITANVVVLDNPTLFNRLGAQNPNWITYALERDVVHWDDGNPLDSNNGKPCTDTSVTDENFCKAGNVQLRPDKRPRPLVVRSVEGSCLTVNFKNLLDPRHNPNNAQLNTPNPAFPVFEPDPNVNCALPENADNRVCVLNNNDQVAGRCAGFHASGTELRNITPVGGESPMDNDGSMVGNNPGANIGPTDLGQDNCGPGMVGPDKEMTYNLYTPHEGAYIINSYGATLGGEANAGNLGIGMLGGLNVQPKGARMYRGQLTEEEMRLATVGTTDGGQPIIDYEATYPDVEPWISEGKAGLPIINMLTADNELVHSDINAIIAGPNADGSFPESTYPLESVGNNNPAMPTRLEAFREFSSIWHDEQTNSQVFPKWYQDPVLGHTLHPVGDAFMINYGSGGIGSEIIANRLHTGPMHDCTDCAYEEFFLASQTVGDPGMLVNFPANTGIENCAPNNILDPTCWRDFLKDVTPDDGVDNPIAVGANPPIPGNYALFPADPGNLHHAYVGDAVKIRNIHAGAFEQHIFHLHNHQWLFNPNDDNANYLDAQEIMPGSGHTYELVYGGAGNRNKTAGDAIFHCHFYPHFAQGMWYHIRIKDVFESGTVLAVSNADDPQNPTTGFHVNDVDNDGLPDWALRSGQPAVGARAQPDGELLDGTPIPAIVPLPGKAMPPMPAKVTVTAVDRGDYGVLSGRFPPNGLLQGADSAQAVVDMASVAGPDTVVGTADDLNPGYPFWLAGNSCGVPTADDPCPEGVVGQRMPTPPLDMLSETAASANGYEPTLAGGHDGGLPRHALRGYTSGGVSLDTNNRLSFRKVVERAQPVFFPELGTDLEQVAMGYHAVRERPSAAQDFSVPGGAVKTGPDVNFVLNGSAPVPGGPFNDPCVDDTGAKVGATGNQWFDGIGGLGNMGYSEYDWDNPRTYKIANIQIDAVFNKVGQHYPQERIISLWEDVAPTIAKQRPPEPLVMRFNTFDCGKLLHTNLVPAEYELDDFQVRTPTDIIGQHIHLPKWDLTTNDGAANGWNYEDGALSPIMVQERIHAIDVFNAEVAENEAAADAGLPLPHPDLVGLTQVATLPNPCGDNNPDCGTPGGLTDLTAVGHPFFGVGQIIQTSAGPEPEYKGARTVIQRLMMDPLHNVAGVDRGLGLTFSHDHYGPSTFQQVGLYSTILAEPAGSTWVHNESGEPLGTRADGGPTTWQAAILTDEAATGVPSHREFYFEMSDFQHAYNAGVYVGGDDTGRPKLTVIEQPDPFDATLAYAPAIQETWKETINPPLKVMHNGGFPSVVTAKGGCPGPAGVFDPTVPRPCAEAINISHSSTWVVNYRNESVGLRVFDPDGIGPDGQDGTLAPGQAGDLAFALQSRIDREVSQLNTSFGDTPYPAGSGTAAINGGGPEYCSDPEFGDGINCDRRPGDPFTPIMRAFDGDHVKIKIQVGATEEQHQTTVHGIKWLSNGSAFGRSPNSGWRNFQSHGISEQFSLQVPITRDPDAQGNETDYLYATDATREGFWLGTWGVLRAYRIDKKDLFELPNNPSIGITRKIANADEFVGVCPASTEENGGGGKKGGKKGGPVPANLVTYNVTAVLANQLLPNELGVTIPANTNPTDNVGGPLDPNGGTLVYNRRGTEVPGLGGLPGGAGPLNDPTAIMYFLDEDLVFDADTDQPIALKPGVPVEPLVLRANAGDCIEVRLNNALPAIAPDLAGWQDILWGVTRRIQKGEAGPEANPNANDEMHFFNNNLIRPSSYVGLHPQMVEYDMGRDDGVLVGINDPDAIVQPGEQHVYRWYAGDLREEFVEEKIVAGKGKNKTEVQHHYRFIATPVEFGASNLLSADRVKQPQKGLFGALSILPAGSTVVEDTVVADGQGMGDATRGTRAQVTVNAPEGLAGSGGTFRENLLVGHKIANLRWKDGSAIRNIAQADLGIEGAEDSGHAGFNYGMEPSWFRFQLPPDSPWGNATTPDSFGALENQQAFFANKLVEGQPNAIPYIAGVSAAGDPATPVFRASAGQKTRMHVLNGASADRDGTFILHGHLWQRDPFVCPGEADLGLIGRCNPSADTVDSAALGVNPQGKWMGGEEGMGHVYGYWPILLESAGGTDKVKGDYLFRDYAPNGYRNGQFGVLRVE